MDSNSGSAKWQSVAWIVTVAVLGVAWIVTVAVLSGRVWHG